MIRELAINPPGVFKSDLDLVIDCTALRLQRVMSRYNASKNRFGGYRVHVGTRNVDIWPLSNTWAFEKGYVRGGTFPALTQTTFFNWDAAVYDLSNSTLHYSSEYFRWLQTGILEINLEPNPNPAGNVRRALRLALSGDARLGPRLTDYVLRFLTDSDFNATRLENYSRYFVFDVVKTVTALLARHVNERPGEPFDIASTQLRLGILNSENPQGIPTTF